MIKLVSDVKAKVGLYNMPILVFDISIDGKVHEVRLAGIDTEDMWIYGADREVLTVSEKVYYFIKRTPEIKNKLILNKNW